MWNLPGLGIKFMSLAPAGGFLTTGPQGNSSNFYLNEYTVIISCSLINIHCSRLTISGSHIFGIWSLEAFFTRAGDVTASAATTFVLICTCHSLSNFPATQRKHVGASLCVQHLFKVCFFRLYLHFQLISFWQK